MSSNIKRNKVPQITQGIKILWHAGYWDGFLSGIAEYNGENYYFDLKKEYDSKKLRDSVYRTFWVYKLTPEQWAKIKYWHEEFDLHVGTHTNYTYRVDEDGEQVLSRHAGSVHAASHEYRQEMFYERYRQYILDNGAPSDGASCDEQVVGWCTFGTLLGRPEEDWKESSKARKQAKKNVTQEKATKS